MKGFPVKADPMRISVKTLLDRQTISAKAPPEEPAAFWLENENGATQGGRLALSPLRFGPLCFPVCWAIFMYENVVFLRNRSMEKESPKIENVHV